MQTTLKLNTSLTVEEIPSTTDLPGVAANQKITTSQFNKSATLTGSTTPAVSKHASFKKTLTSNAATIDLTSLAGTLATISLSGLKPVALRVVADSQNGNPITVAKGASSGYTGLGSSFSATLAAGQGFTFDFDAAGTAVSGSVKTLDLIGTGSSDFVKVTIVGG